MGDDLHAHHGRGATEVEQIDVAPQRAREVLRQLPARQRRQGPREQDGQIEIAVAMVVASGGRAEQVKTL